MENLQIESVFYRELLQVRIPGLFSEDKHWLPTLWNKDLIIEGKSKFYKTYFDSEICTVKDLLLNLNNTECFEVIPQ